MRFLLAKAVFRLALFDWFLLRDDFSGLHRRVEKYPVAKRIPSAGAKDRICERVDYACFWYPKRSLCLQRSATLTVMLRNYGLPAQMVIGVQKLPFRAHAWVELDGEVINDKSDMPQIYMELMRC